MQVTKVQKFEAGDHVIALAKDCFASHVAADENFVALIPDSLRDEAIVGMPTAYITALICLDRMTGIRSGDSILIHCASGGVGLALVNLAQARNLQIFATAGAKKKKISQSSWGSTHIRFAFPILCKRRSEMDE